MCAGEASSRAGESLAPEERLRRRTDYLRCYRKGRRRHGALMILYYVPNELGHPRIGVTASRKVGGAVVRQRLKRRVREIYRRWKGRSDMPGVDMVVHFKPTAAQAGFGPLMDELVGLLASVGGRRRREEA